MPVSGAWRVTYSLYSVVDSGEYTIARLYFNGEDVSQTVLTTYSESGEVGSTGARELTLDAGVGDKIEIRTTTMDRYCNRIIFCTEFIPKM